MPKYYTPRKAISFANSGTAAFSGMAQTVEKTALYTSDRQETPAELGGVIRYRRDHRQGLVSSLYPPVLISAIQNAWEIIAPHRFIIAVGSNLTPPAPPYAPAPEWTLKMPTGVVLTAVLASRLLQPPYPVYILFDGALGDGGEGVLTYTDSKNRKASITLTLWTP
jgi:hypothetical protein